MQDKILNPFISAVILAGGEGNRLWPLTADRSKPSVSFAGKYKLIDIALSNAINAGIQDLFVTTQYHAKQLNAYLSDTFIHQNIRILSPVKQSSACLYKGTADSVRKNILQIASHPAEYIFILSGDQIYNMPLLDMLDFAKKHDSQMVISSLSVKEHDAKRMGLLKINSDHKIVDFKEKPEEQKELEHFRLEQTGEARYLGSMGIYLFKRDTLINLLLDHPGDDFGRDLIPTLIQEGKGNAYIFDGYWQDVGTVHSYYQANLQLMQPDGFNLYHTHIHSKKHILPSPCIQNTKLKSSIIADGSIIEAYEIQNSTIGMCMHIQEGTRIKNSILMGNDNFCEHSDGKLFSIGKNCLFDGVIIDQNCQIGDNVTLINRSGIANKDFAPLYVRDKIIIVPSGTILPDNYELCL